MKKTYSEPRPNDLIITIKRLGINGEGIGYYKKKIIFIPGALPEEVVVAKIIKSYPRYLQGELVRIKVKSPDRVPFPKDVDPRVGGLELAHLNYDKQLRFKQDLITESLAKYHPRDYKNYKVKRTVPAPSPWHYRSKAQYQIAQNEGKIQLGLFAPNSHDLIDLPSMPTQSEHTQKTERAIKRLVQEKHVPIADFARRRPGLKTIAVREAQASQEIQVTFITIGKHIANLTSLAEACFNLEHVVSVFQNETQWDNSQVWGNKTTKLKGKDHITEVILDHQFALSPRAFFQLNPVQTQTLYTEALKYLDLAPDQTLIDAYSGVGTLGILASDRVRRVIGIESISDAVADAQYNCQLNHVRNAEFLQGSVERILPELQESGVNIDALIVDPPRSGLAKSLIKTILTVKPKTFVYVSCNPSTLAQDLMLLTQRYNVRLISSVDMLPQTPRCEAVVKLVLR